MEGSNKITTAKTILNAEEVAFFLGISINTIRQWTSEKKIPAHHIGAKVFYNRHEILNLLGGEGTPQNDPVILWLLEQLEERRRQLSLQIVTSA